MGDHQGALISPAVTARRRIALAAAVLAALAALASGFATQRSYLLLRSAQDAGAPRTSSIRAWMSLDYVARSYDVPVDVLVARLGLPPDANSQATIRATAETTGAPRFEFVQRVQKAVATSGAPSNAAVSTDWLSRAIDAALSAVVTFGYAGYAAIRFLGSVGFPLPDGVASVLAGSLSFQGQFAFWPSVALGALFAVAGDMVGYALGAWAGSGLVARHGPRIGLTAARKVALDRALRRWGLWTVIVTRTLASSLGGPINLLAGMGRYAPAHFLMASGAGRLAWTFAYVWLGYTVGADVEAAASFLRSLLACLFALLIFGLAVLVARSGGQLKGAVSGD